MPLSPAAKMAASKVEARFQRAGDNGFQPLKACNSVFAFPRVTA
jgi:hypothetical protein